MKLFTQQLAALTLVAAVLNPAYAQAQTIMVDESGAFDPSTVLQSPAPETVEVLAFDMNRIVMQQTRLIRYQATEYQRKVADARARAYMAAHRRTAADTAKKSPEPSKKPKTVAKKSTPEPEEPKKGVAKKATPKPEPKEEPKVAAKPKPLPRYIAVDTVKDKRASPQAKKVVMIWDTHSETLVGNDVYDVQAPPPVGATTKFDTYVAEYIGAGN